MSETLRTEETLRELCGAAKGVLWALNALVYRHEGCREYKEERAALDVAIEHAEHRLERMAGSR